MKLHNLLRYFLLLPFFYYLYLFVSGGFYKNKAAYYSLMLGISFSLVTALMITATRFPSIPIVVADVLKILGERREDLSEERSLSGSYKKTSSKIGIKKS